MRQERVHSNLIQLPPAPPRFHKEKVVKRMSFLPIHQVTIMRSVSWAVFDKILEGF